MITRLTPSTARSLAFLVRTEQWRAVEASLNAELLATYERLRDTADTATIHELRGRARVLSDILKLLQKDKLDAIGSARR